MIPKYWQLEKRVQKQDDRKVQSRQRNLLEIPGIMQMHTLLQRLYWYYVEISLLPTKYQRDAIMVPTWLQQYSMLVPCRSFMGNLTNMVFLLVRYSQTIVIPCFIRQNGYHIILSCRESMKSESWILFCSFSSILQLVRNSHEILFGNFY